MDENFNEVDYSVYTLKNPFSKDFQFFYAKRPFIIRANSELALPASVAKHGARRLVDKLIETREGFANVNVKEKRRHYLKMVLPEVELEDVEDIPQTKAKSENTEGLIDSPFSESPTQEAQNEVIGENTPVTSNQSEDPMGSDAEIDLNAPVNTPQDFTEEELRMEALKDTDPIKYRALQLEKMDWNDFRAYAKEKGAEGKNKEELIQSVLRVEFPGSTIA